jgi:hypothetical protein
LGVGSVSGVGRGGWLGDSEHHQTTNRSDHPASSRHQPRLGFGREIGTCSGYRCCIMSHSSTLTLGSTVGSGALHMGHTRCLAATIVCKHRWSRVWPHGSVTGSSSTLKHTAQLHSRATSCCCCWAGSFSVRSMKRPLLTASWRARSCVSSNDTSKVIRTSSSSSLAAMVETRFQLWPSLDRLLSATSSWEHRWEVQQCTVSLLTPLFPPMRPYHTVLLSTFGDAQAQGVSVTRSC